MVFPTSADEDKELITIIGRKEGVDAAKEELLKSIKELVSLGLADPSCYNPFNPKLKYILPTFSREMYK